MPVAAPTELEIDDEDLALFPSLREVEAVTPSEGEAPAAPLAAAPELEDEARRTTIPTELSPEERLALAADALQGAEMRDDIADAVLDFCEPYFRRRMLLVMRKGAIVGWRGEGERVDEASVRAISIPVTEPSVFLGLDQGQSFWLGTLPPMPRNQELVLGLGGTHPGECVVLPIVVKTKVVAYLYGDNVDGHVTTAPMGQLRRLMTKAGLAFQVYLLKSKIRLI